MDRFPQGRRRQDRKTNGDLSDSLVTVLDPPSAASEAYRTVRTSLLYSQVDTLPKVIVITSPGLKEGKSTICANLGVVLAQVGKNTLVMDCDLRKPAIHKILGIRNFYGVVDALAGEEMPEGGWPEAVPGLKVATAGLMPSNPVELLSSKRFTHLLEGEREKFDYVLIDAPPAGGALSDSWILAVQADGVLLVLDCQNTSNRSLREAVRNLESVGARIFGMVMNNMKVEKNSLLR